MTCKTAVISCALIMASIPLAGETPIIFAISIAVFLCFIFSNPLDAFSPNQYSASASSYLFSQKHESNKLLLRQPEHISPDKFQIDPLISIHEHLCQLKASGEIRALIVCD